MLGIAFRNVFGLTSKLCGIAAVLCASSPAPAAPPRYRVQLFPPLPGFEFAAPFGMNAWGEIVGYSGPEAYDPFATAVLIERDGTVTSPKTPDPNYNFVQGINENGQIVGESGRTPFILENGEWRILPRPEAFFSGTGNDINNQGVICGSVGDSDEIGPQHCVWTDSTLEPKILEGILPGSTTGSCWEINEKGQIAGVSGSLVGTFYAARWDDPDAIPLQIGPLEGAFNSEGLGINELGDVVGRSSFESGEIEAFFYESATGDLRGLGSLADGQVYSEARDVNDRQQVVGVARAAEGIVHAFLWEGGVMHDLNDLVVAGDPKVRYLMGAWAINDLGQIAVEAVVEGQQPDFPRQIALLTPVLLSFRRGDCNDDGRADISDAVCTLGWLFLGDPTPGCAAATNTNGDALTDISDAVGLLAYLFQSGPAPVAPFPECGPPSLPTDEAACPKPPATCP